MKQEEPLFLDVDFDQRKKAGQYVCGDSFFSRKLPGRNRVVSVLSDGLGSGVKASILSSMTGTMALRFMEGDMEILRSAEVMMDALPVCRKRGISYATFTIVDAVLHGWTRVIEMDNPSFMLVRNGRLLAPGKREMASSRWKDRKITVNEFFARPEDRIILFSDGVTQAGMGSWANPTGWGQEKCAAFILDTLKERPGISSRELSRRVVSEALVREPHERAGDDVTCAVMYFRSPRKLLVLSGPPFEKKRDAEFARMLDTFDGRRAVCGGTTAEIVARELGRPLVTDLATARGGLPPISTMDGADLITEGILTLTEVSRILEGKKITREKTSASRLAALLEESDRIRFVVGTRVNEAHQDPTLPVELEMRRNIVRTIARTLEERYLKEVELTFV